VRVDDDPFDHVVAVLEDDVRGLAAHTGEIGEVGHRVRDPSLVLLDHQLSGLADVARLVVVVGNRVQRLGEFVLRGVRERFRRRVRFEQFDGRLVHPLVGTLRREDDRDEEFESGREIERDRRIGVLDCEAVDYFRSLVRA
jgi:hypothetical protein